MASGSLAACRRGCSTPPLHLVRLGFPHGWIHTQTLALVTDWWWWYFVCKDIVIRTYNPTYIKYVDLWWTKLLNHVVPMLYENGGPIVMVQVCPHFFHMLPQVGMLSPHA